MRRAALLVALAAACGPSEEPGLIDTEELDTAAERVAPTLLVQSPARGIFTDAVAVMVSGSVTQGSAPVTLVEVNGTPARLDGAIFDHELTLQPGPNLIGVRAEASDNGRAVDALTVFAGPVWQPGSRIEDAMRVHLGREFLDDNDPDLDDVASIVELIVADEMFLGSLTAEPFMVGDETVTVTRVEVGSAAVDLVPETNCVATAITIRDVALDLTTTGIAAILGEQVYVTADAGTVTLLICGGDAPGQFEVLQPQVTFDNLVLATNDYPDLAEDLPSTHATLVGLLESAMGNWLGSSLGGFLTQLLDIFQLDYTFGALQFAYELVELSATPSGLDLVLAGTVSSQFGLPLMPPGAGSLRTDDAPLGDGFSAAPLAVALSDDALNQLFFAYWWSGAIADYALDPAALEALPEVFQPLSSFEVVLGLPPTLLPPLQPEYAFDLAVGETGLRIVAGTDRVFDTAIHLRSGVNLAVDEAGGIGLQMDGRAQKITVLANVTQSPATHEKGDVAALLRLIVPAVLGEVEVNYGGFPLPDFELSAFSENVAAFQGRTVRFAPSGTRRAGDGGGYLVLEGALTE